jgi:hypothetical protein
MKKILCLAAPVVLALGVMTGGVVAAFAASSAPPPAPPGQGDCSHGNTGKACRPDPQPGQGKDCHTHGNDGVGGVNEDHCLGTAPTTSTDVTTTSQTTTGQTTTNETTTNETTSPATTKGPSAAAPAVTKPQLHAELAKQVAKVGTGRVSPARSVSGQLPFTGSSVWILTLLGAAMLATGLGVRRLTA